MVYLLTLWVTLASVFCPAFLDLSSRPSPGETAKWTQGLPYSGELALFLTRAEADTFLAVAARSQIIVWE